MDILVSERSSQTSVQQVLSKSAKMNDQGGMIMDKSLRSVFVGNIPYEATEEKLKDIFSEVGQVGEFVLQYSRIFPQSMLFSVIQARLRQRDWEAQGVRVL